jgi:hypothetical protein
MFSQKKKPYENFFMKEYMVIKNDKRNYLDPTEPGNVFDEFKIEEKLQIDNYEILEMIYEKHIVQLIQIFESVYEALDKHKNKFV